ncbi:unnamed protein product [Acanthoscelides obtectus]|uniref:Nuclease HARBI1 n=1 Tax=Acanthoscelides obtectus TaxID=200917 RepID=A0A9P0KWN8_ACAOB|nr:unnamed protein product [Acanthoscelides obtectus]CAK1641964.1 hypothetical protein AOBTE_LOCUS12762 [Acanthoscelides obtectus]
MPTYQPTKVFKDRRESREVDYRALYRFSKVNGRCFEQYRKNEGFLRYVGDPGFQIGIGEAIGVHQSTASRTVSNVITRIVQNSNIWIRFPTTSETLVFVQVKRDVGALLLINLVLHQFPLILVFLFFRRIFTGSGFHCGCWSVINAFFNTRIWFSW